MRRANSVDIDTVVLTPAAGVIHPDEVESSLERHSRCDWGKLCREDRAVQDFAVQEGLHACPLVSFWQSRCGIDFFIETSHGVTTVGLCGSVEE